MAHPTAPKPPDATAHRRWLLSYRASLVAVPLLVAAAGMGIALATYLSTRETIAALAQVLFQQVSREAANQARDLALQAVPAVELLAARRELPDDAQALARELLPVLRSNPAFAWVSYGRADGAFAGVYRTPAGAVRANLSAIRDGRTELSEFDVDAAGAWTLARHEADTRYDPRTRPFYRLAAEAGRRAWTAPYVFYEQGVPGISCATPRRGAGGALEGVFSVDFDLNLLSQFMARLQPSPRGRVFVYTADQTLLAHPTAHAVVQPGGRDAGKLLSVRDADDPAMAAFLAASAGQPASGGAGARHFAFASGGGERFLGSSYGFEVDAGLRWTVGVIAPEDDFLAAVRTRHLQGLVVSIVVLLLGLGLALALAARLAGPLARLSAEMAEVGRFRLEPWPGPSTRFREIEEMSRAVANMKSGLRSFAAYVPRDLVRRVLASGRAAALDGEVREMSVFFSDVAGFTAIAETMRPEMLVRFLAVYYQQMTQIISELGGTVDKFMGDGVMAFWNAPDACPDHARRACEAALRCKEMLDELSRARGNQVRLRARVGIATGEVLVGNIGTSDRMNYTVLGDIVNVASRLEGLNKLYGTWTLVTEETRRAAGDAIVARPIDVVALKGKAKSTRVYDVLGLAGELPPAVTSRVEPCERALAAYLARDFRGAVEAWEAALALSPGDRPVQVMLERARGYLANPPPADWTGYFAVSEK